MTRLVLLVLAVAACDDKPTITRPDAAPPLLSIDVIATPALVSLRTHSTDRTDACIDSTMQFATYDACVGISDILCPPASCLTAKLTGTGVMQPDSYGARFLIFPVPSPMPDDLELELSGCGHPKVVIPIEPFVAPTPTLTAQVMDNEVIASWQTDIPAESSYVELITSLWAQECHPLGSEQTFDLYALPAFFTVRVTTFLPYTTMQAALGEIRIWRGNSMEMFWQMQ